MYRGREDEATRETYECLASSSCAKAKQLNEDMLLKNRNGKLKFIDYIIAF